MGEDLIFKRDTPHPPKPGKPENVPDVGKTAIPSPTTSPLLLLPHFHPHGRWEKNNLRALEEVVPAHIIMR